MLVNPHFGQATGICTSGAQSGLTVSAFGFAVEG